MESRLSDVRDWDATGQGRAEILDYVGGSAWFAAVGASAAGWLPHIEQNVGDDMCGRYISEVAESIDIQVMCTKGISTPRFFLDTRGASETRIVSHDKPLTAPVSLPIGSNVLLGFTNEELIKAIVGWWRSRCIARLLAFFPSNSIAQISNESLEWCFSHFELSTLTRLEYDALVRREVSAESICLKAGTSLIVTNGPEVLYVFSTNGGREEIVPSKPKSDGLTIGCGDLLTGYVSRSVGLGNPLLDSTRQAVERISAGLHVFGIEERWRILKSGSIG